jgi:hypothetical protein
MDFAAPGPRSALLDHSAQRFVKCAVVSIPQSAATKPAQCRRL